MLNIKRSITVLAITALMSFFALAQKAENPAAAQTGLNLRSLDGETVNVQGQKGKVVVLAVGAVWLPLSKQQAAIVNKLAKTYANKNVEIYWVSTDSDSPKSKNYASDEQIKAFAVKNKLTVTILRDPAGLTLKKFAVDQIPSFVVLDKNGKAASEAFGGLDPETDITPDIAAKIDELL
jgi:thiol-disulfide isomerase/thioredoxin